MPHDEQVKQFADELDRLVERYRDEYDLTYAAVVGTLHMKAYLLCGEAGERSEEAT